ncbi:MAG TPA: hypothetical protein VLU46_05425 [Thermoanaerobaculia bacterium]|nr:hypothetical protein [Thermoanaerobaculia bacterium]
MKTRTFTTLCLSLALLVSVSAAAQTSNTDPATLPNPEPSTSPAPYDLEIGFRTSSVKGNEDMYRTQINERSGVLLHDFTLSTVDFGGRAGMIDNFRIDVSDLGTGPASSVRIQTGRSGSYRLLLNLRRTSEFSALPIFANPFAGQGIIPGQHTYDRTRTLLDGELEFLLGGKISPFVGYTFNRYSGPGRTTYSLGGDEFQVSDDRTDTDNELRAGFTFTASKYTGMVSGGFRNQSTHQTLSLVQGAGAGNNNTPIFGRPVNATAITQTSRDKITTPFVNAFTTAQFTNRIKVIANLALLNAKDDATDSSSATGSFVSFPISRLFGGVTEDANSSAKNRTWRGGARTEIGIVDNVDFLAGYQREQRDLKGSGVFNTIFQQTLTFGGLDPRDITDLLNVNNEFKRTEDVINAAVAARALGPFAVRVGVSHSSQDINITPDLSEIVVPGPNQGGDYKRAVNSFDGNASYGRGGLILGAAYRKDKANDPILRTDFIDRDRIRVRAGYTAPRWVRFGVSADQTKQSNNATGINYDAKIRQYLANVEISPFTPVRFRVEAGQYRADSSILFRRPENFALDTSIHSEKGNSLDAGIGFNWKGVMFDADAARFDNTGTTPFTIDRYRARASYDFKSRYGVAVEYWKDKYTEKPFLFGDYDANRVGVFLRLRQ